MWMTAIVLASWLMLLGEANLIRILSSDSQSNAQSELGAFKSKIRALTLKSTLKCSFAILSDTPSPIDKTSTAAAADITEPQKVENQLISRTTLPSANSTFFTPTYPQAPYPIGPPVRWPTGCFCIKPCEGCSCYSAAPIVTTPDPENSPTDSAPSEPIILTTPDPSAPSAADPCQSTLNPSATTALIHVQPRLTSPEPTIPFTQRLLCPSTPEPCHGSFCLIPIVIPCYACPCIDRCSILPADKCSCIADPSVEYRCPYDQIYGVRLSELSEKITSGFRLAETLRPPPSCIFNANDWLRVQHFQLRDDEPTELKAYQDQSSLPAFFRIGVLEQPNHFAPPNVGKAKDFSGSQSSNYYLYRQQRQQPFAQQYGLAGVDGGSSYPRPPLYLLPADSYPIPSVGKYPIGPHPLYPTQQPPVQQNSTRSSSSTIASSFAVGNVSLPVVFVLMVTLLTLLGLPN